MVGFVVLERDLYLLKLVIFDKNDQFVITNIFVSKNSRFESEISIFGIDLAKIIHRTSHFFSKNYEFLEHFYIFCHNIVIFESITGQNHA